MKFIKNLARSKISFFARIPNDIFLKTLFLPSAVPFFARFLCRAPAFGQSGSVARAGIYLIRLTVMLLASSFASFLLAPIAADPEILTTCEADLYPAPCGS